VVSIAVDVSRRPDGVPATAQGVALREVGSVREAGRAPVPHLDPSAPGRRRDLAGAEDHVVVAIAVEVTGGGDADSSRVALLLPCRGSDGSCRRAVEE